MLQGVDITRRSDGSYAVVLACVVCGGRLTLLDFVAFHPPGRGSMETGMLVHQRCGDRNIRQLTSSGHMAMLRMDEFCKQLAYILDEANSLKV